MKIPNVFISLPPIYTLIHLIHLILRVIKQKKEEVRFCGRNIFELFGNRVYTCIRRISKNGVLYYLMGSVSFFT